jgi:predicted PurR-regulated permease PerM
MSEDLDTPSPEETPERDVENGQARLNRNFVLLFLAVVLVVFFNMVKFFVVPVILAAVLASLFYPLQRWMLRRLGNRRSLSSLMSCLVILLCLLIPIYAVVGLIGQQAVELYDSAEEKSQEILDRVEGGFLDDVRDSRIVQALNLNEIDWESLLKQGAQKIGNLIGTVINRTSRGILELFGTLLVMLFTMFYFFRDGKDLVQELRRLSPLEESYEEKLVSRFLTTSQATVKGTLLIGLIQGTMGALTLLAFGVGTWLLWGLVMVILSIMPMVGTGLVLIPAGVFKIIQGNTWQGIGIFLVSLVIISNVDNLIRPRLVGRSSGMHELMVFFSTLGGIAIFGVLGFIVGPIIGALLLAVLDMYRMEFGRELNDSA